MLPLRYNKSIHSKGGFYMYEPNYTDPIQPEEEQPVIEQPVPQPIYHTPPVYYYAQPQIPPQPEAPKTEAPKTEPRRSKKLGLKIVALSLCCALLGGILGAGGVLLVDRLKGGTLLPGKTVTVLEGEREDVVLNVNKVETGKEMTPAEVYAANVNSTVGITTSVVTTNIFGYQTAAAAGSGFILSEDGYILTNYHVVEGASSVEVSAYDGTGYEAELIGYDESNDIAVLKVDATGLTPVILGNSDKTNVGDSVVAIGNPLGELTFSLTLGVVSALDREVTMSNGITMDLIQTDCAINSGNSGGALFNMYGEVIGITNAKYSTGNTMSAASIDNIGFAIPVNSIRDIVESIIEKGYVSKPYIGITVSTVSEESQSYGLPKGAAVKSVLPDSPAEEGGLLVSDIVTEANGVTITSSDELVDLVGDLEIGDTLNLKVYRQGETLELTITIGENRQSAIQEPVEETPETEDTPSGGFPWDFPWGFGG